MAESGGHVDAVPFANFPRAIAEMRGQIDAAIARVMDRGWLVLGPEGEAFEAALAEFTGAAHGIGCGTGTDAIEIALRALEIGPGDEVITQANTCVPTVAAIARAGATPVLCDVEPEAAVIDPDSLAQAVTPRTRAVVPVHLYGQVGPIEQVCELADRRGLAVVEDCAQSIGAAAGGRGAGSFGAAGCFSFYPTKNLGALGDGGAVVCSDPDLAERLRKVRVYGQESRYQHAFEGVNSRLDEVQAAVLLAKLELLDTWNERRRAIAAVYSEALADTSARPLRLLEARKHVFHLYVVEVNDRDRFRAELERRGVATLIHYPLPIHRQPAYSSLGRGAVGLGNSERLAERVVSLPIYPELRDAEVEHVAAAAAAAAS